MIPRAAAKAVLSALADTPVVLINGARQTGKSTLAQSIALRPPTRAYFTLDDAATLAAATADPQGFIDGLDSPVVIDEVQRAPDLFRAIKRSVDRDRRPGRFILTGSANAMLVPRASESLAGRVQVIQLWPLSQSEIDAAPGRFVERAFGDRPFPRAPDPSRPAFIDRILRGGYPEAISRADPNRRASWFGSYISTILQRDVRDLANIEGLSDMPRLLALVASRAAGLLNFSDLSSALAIPQSTLKRYFSLLEVIFLVTRLPAWSTNSGTRLVKAQKVMLCDTGLSAHLLSLDAQRLKDNPNFLGPLVENFAALELLKQLSAAPTPIRLFHFRTTAGREVDLVLEEPNGRIVGVEVRSAASVNNADFAGLRALAELAGRRFHRGIVLYSGPETVPFDKHMTAAPIHSLWTVP